MQIFNIGDRVEYNHSSERWAKHNGAGGQIRAYDEYQNSYQIDWDDPGFAERLDSTHDKSTWWNRTVLQGGKMKYSPEQNGDVEEDI